MSTRVLVLSGFAFLFSLCQNSVAQTCSPGSTDPSVTICTPQSGVSLNSPIHLQIATNDSSQVDRLQVWYNGVKRFENPVSSADFFLATGGGGPYRITALAHDVSGRWFQSTVSINVIGEIYVCTQPQTASQSPRSVVICQPADGEIHFSPVHLTWNALAAPGEQPTSVQIFLDGKSVFQTPPALSNGFPLPATALPMAIGRHRISIQAYDSQGAFKSTLYMKVDRIYQGCAPPAVLPDMVVCSLTDGQTVNGVITVKAAAAAATGILRFVEILDGVQVLNTSHAWLDNGLSVAPGPHTLILKATTNSGAHIQKTFNVTSQ
ncbi:MAG TPA: Ig-like domain-containing protein [Terriglobales bacterium]|nr:Ig-like domain-containing protein [Terriglobales bacterium]